eukprot:CAMPEP_0116131770 /NCGR_PEP_ID=MMETSP0329-20121206/9187_1 /TAXON_ID=697910 /ORGANISM="Pseudo-nitzschia arenysensis, Strain B593" /LENGTH=518 /DNA_ID=CAMNT_0003626231 /DNA_START=232 /DNA_END=1788 /DNA_ORIENTATION=-
MVSTTQQMLRGASLEGRNLASYNSAPASSSTTGSNSASTSTTTSSEKSSSGFWGGWGSSSGSNSTSTSESTSSNNNYAGQVYNGTSDYAHQAYDGAKSTAGQVYNGTTTSAQNFADHVKHGTTDLVRTNPSEWTDYQYLSVASILIGFWTLMVMITFCKKSCDDRREKREWEYDLAYMAALNSDKKEALLESHKENTYRHEMKRPFVTKGSPVSNGSVYDAKDPAKLPLGARLHGGHKLHADGLTGTGVRIAVIDSGIDESHPGLHDKVKNKRWFRDGTPLEEDDHGTHVAGTIHFMAPDADLYDYRVFGQDGEDDGDTAIAKSIMQAVEVDKCQVINMSLRCSYPVRPLVQKAIQHAYKQGVHLVCAAGNDGDGNESTDELYTFPARFDETISVAAVRKEQGLPTTGFSESNSDVTYSGIGRDVISLKPSGGFQIMSGTSMATPHVTGLIACLLSNSKTYSDSELRKILKEKYLVDIGSKGYDKQTGEGFVTYLSGDGSKDEVFELLSQVDYESEES